MKPPKGHYFIVWDCVFDSARILNCSEELEPTDELLQCLTKDEFYEDEIKCQERFGRNLLWLTREEILKFYGEDNE